MKPTLTLLGRSLKTALVGLAKVVPRKPSRSALKCLCIGAGPEPDTLTFTGTDGVTFLELVLTAEEVPDAFEPFLVPFGELRDALKTCATGEVIRLQPDGEDSLTLIRETGSASIPQTWKAAPISEFPKRPVLDATPFTLESSTKEALQQALACTSGDPARQILRGACMEGGRSFIGTDGRHLYRANSMSLPVKQTVILPHHRVLNWKPVRDSASWCLAYDLARFQLAGDHWVLTGNLIEGNYPNWKQVLPGDKAFKTVATISESRLAELASTVGSLPGEKLLNKPVGLRLKDRSLTLLARGEDDATFGEVPVEETAVTGPAVTVFVNREYLAKALSFGLNQIEIIDESSPVRLRAEPSNHRDLIVMPIRVTAPEPIRKPSRKTNQPQHSPMKNNQTTQTEPKSNGGNNGHHAAEEDPSPIEAVTTQLLQTKSLLRQALNELAELGNGLKQVRAEKKATEKEFRQVRTTLRSLQKVEL